MERDLLCLMLGMMDIPYCPGPISTLDHGYKNQTIPASLTGKFLIGSLASPIFIQGKKCS